MYIYLLHNGGFWETIGPITSYDSCSFVALNVSSQSFNIFNVLQLVCIVSNPSVLYFETVDIRSWYCLSAQLTSVMAGSFPPGVHVVYKFIL